MNVNVTVNMVLLKHRLRLLHCQSKPLSECVSTTSEV